MNIIFDLFSSQPFSPYAKFNGGGQYVKSIFKHFILENQYHKNKIYCTYNPIFYLDDEISSLCVRYEIELLDINVFDINYYISIHNIEKVFIGILQRYLNLVLPIDVKLIIVVHDMRDLEIFPTKEELFYLSRLNGIKSIIKLSVLLIFYSLWKRYRNYKNLEAYNSVFNYLKKNNSEIWTVSNHTKNLILSKFSFLDQDKIKIFWSPEIKVNSHILKIPSIENLQFFMLVSCDHWEKNTLNIINSFILYNKNQLKKINLVIVGDLSDTPLECKIKKYGWIYNFSNLEESQIEWLYSQTEMLIYLSYVEGFGYPPINAMKYGKPILASATSSIMEICGNAPIYCCPYSKSEVLARINYVMNNDISHFRQESIKRHTQILNKQRVDLTSMTSILHN